MRRSAQPLRPAILAGCVAAILAAQVEAASLASSHPVAPLSGVLSADGVPLAGVSLVVRGLTGAAASVVRVLKTDAEGTFCLADAGPGVYSVLAAVPGFRSASAQVLHRARPDTVSFVRLELARERRGVLPAGPGGALDPWSARAVVAGDVLRKQGPVEPSPEPAPAPAPVGTASASTANVAAFPVRGSVASMQGFAAEGGSARSQTSLDVSGSLGGGVRWGLSGEYDRVMSASGERLGDTSRVALDVLPAEGHSIRLSSHRSEIPSAESPDGLLAAHTVDWAASPGQGARASVSARILSHRNLDPTALPTPLFRGEGRALEVDAQYRKELTEGRFVRVQVGYRSELGPSPVAGVTRADRETRIGGVAGIRLLDALLVEAGGTGDYSAASRGLAPEMTLSLEALSGFTVWGFASRRFEQRVPGALAGGIVGIDAADLVRATRSLYRAGFRLESHAAGRIETEASRREISQALQLLLDSDIIDRVDAVYLFPGDVADELSGAYTLAVMTDVSARLALLGGRVRGDGLTAGTLPNEGRYLESSARVDVRPSGTSVAVRYRRLEQELGSSSELFRNERSSVDLTVAQEIPIPLLREIGSRWQALFSLAMGTRRDGEAEPKPNRQMAGGLSLSF